MNNIPEGYKQTEVGVIPQGWEVKKLERSVMLESTHVLAWNINCKNVVDFQ